MDETTLISAEMINLSFGSNKVLSRLSLEIRKGDIFGITGVSGAGKSTLLNVLAGLIDPDEGHVFYNPSILCEKNLKPLNIKKSKNHLKPYIGYSTQDPSFYEELRVTENLDFFGAMYDVPKKIRRKNIEILTKLMGLDEAKNKTAKSLSGGMRKRLDITCALIHNPKVLFLDEPTSDLDPILRRKVWELLGKLNEQGTTIIVSSHFLTEIEETCTRIGILHHGSIIKLIEKGSKGPAEDTWLKIAIKPGSYDALIGELLKQEQIHPEDIFKTQDAIMIKTPHTAKLKEEVQKACHRLSLELSCCERTTKTLSDIFEEIVR